MANENAIAKGKSGSHQVLEIDIDAILQGQAADRNAEGYTTEEWSDLLGYPVYKIRKWLRIATADGSLVHGVSFRRTYNGKLHRFDVYRYVGAKK